MILDNGRSRLAGGRYREMLACIRCGACLNVCPVYRKTGGAAYGPVYSGPMGAVLVPLLAGLEEASDLPHASSLCGACTAACPVKIPLHELLLELRRDLVEERVAPLRERLAFTLWSYAWSSPAGYRISTRLARLGRPGQGLARRPDGAAAGTPLPGPCDEPRRRIRRERGDRRASSSTAARRRRSKAPACRAPSYALADTGSVVLAASPEEPRAASLLPDVHVTLVSEDVILAGLEELFAAVGDDLPSSLAIVTGPSRSADIEQKLTVGVHGPGEVHVVLTASL